VACGHAYRASLPICSPTRPTRNTPLLPLTLAHSPPPHTHACVAQVSAISVLGATLAVQLGLEHLGLVAGPLNRACLSQMLPSFVAYVLIALVHVRF